MRKLSLFASVIVAVLSPSLYASMVIVSWTGTIANTFFNDGTTVMLGQFEVGDTVQGQYQYTVKASTTPGFYRYTDPYSLDMVMTVGANTFTTDIQNPDGKIMISDNSCGTDKFHIDSLNNVPVRGNNVTEIGLWWEGDDTLLSSASLPFTVPDAGKYSGVFYMNSYDSDWRSSGFGGTITSLTLVQIPEPASLVIFTLLMLAQYSDNRALHKKLPCRML